MNKKEHTDILIWIVIKLICNPSHNGGDLTAVTRLWRTGKPPRNTRKSESVCVCTCAYAWIIRRQGSQHI